MPCLFGSQLGAAFSLPKDRFGTGRCYNRASARRSEAKRLEQPASHGSGIRARISIGRGPSTSLRAFAQMKQEMSVIEAKKDEA